LICVIFLYTVVLGHLGEEDKRREKMDVGRRCEQGEERMRQKGESRQEHTGEGGRREAGMQTGEVEGDRRQEKGDSYW
jgi:hypothetical protein